MTLSILLALLQAVATPAAPALPQWDAMPTVGLTGPDRLDADVTLQVMRLAQQRRSCRIGVRALPALSQRQGVRMVGIGVRLIALMAPDGRLLEILAAPGPCDQIRDYARALFDRYNRGRVRPPSGPAAAWYKASFVFSWQP